MQLSPRYILRLAMVVAGVNGLLPGLDARAVEVAADGYGQVLLYPYYTVRGGANGFNTLISIGNSTPDVKAVRLRFHEAREGAPVADFNIYLDAYAIWTGAVFATVDGAGLATADASCTSPVISHDAAQPTPFTNLSYRDGPGDVSLDRVREGYFEVIDIGDYGSPYSVTPNYIALAANHTTFPYPANCYKVANDQGALAAAPSGGLFGSALLISTLQGIDYQYSATALAHFTSAKPTAADYGTLSPSVPSLADANPATSVVVDDGGRTIQSQWSRGIDAVSAVLTVQRLQGEFVLDQGTRSATSWIVTMPTKWFYVHAGQLPVSPYTSAYSTDGACETIPDLANSGVLHNRESMSAGPPDVGLGLPNYPNVLCFASQSLDFGAISIVGSASRVSQIPLVSAIAVGPQYSFPDGWMDLPLDTESGPVIDPDVGSHHNFTSGATRVVAPDGTVTAQSQATYYGLPVVAFSLASYYNGTLTDASGRGVQSSYISGTALHSVVRVE